MFSLIHRQVPYLLLLAPVTGSKATVPGPVTTRLEIDTLLHYTLLILTVLHYKILCHYAPVLSHLHLHQIGITIALLHLTALYPVYRPNFRPPWPRQRLLFRL